MNDELKKLYTYFNYTDEKGFIFTVPTTKEKEHLTIAFDNKRKEFNVHFTDDSIINPTTPRRNYILTMSAFRFFLFLHRIGNFYQQNILKLVLDSKVNLGKLKKHQFLINPLDTSEELKEKLLHITKNGRKWKFKKNSNYDFILENLKFIDEISFLEDIIYQAYKWKGEHLSFQGFVIQFNVPNGLFFIPIKKYNKFSKKIAIAVYNYLNAYPTPETLQFRQLIYERLKHPYIK